MRLGTFLTSVVVALVASSSGASASTVRLSIDVGAIGPVEPARPLESRALELGLGGIPDFLTREPSVRVDALADVSAPRWLFDAIELGDETPFSLRAFGPRMPDLVPISAVAPRIVAPLLEPVRVLTDLIAAQANELFAPGMSVEVGDRVEERYGPLKELSGDIQRGNYLRSDDVTGRAITFDVRLVIAWRPNDVIRLEAGYAIACLTGDGPDQSGVGGLDRTSNYVIHGPCAAFNFDF